MKSRSIGALAAAPAELLAAAATGGAVGIAAAVGVGVAGGVAAGVATGAGGGTSEGTRLRPMLNGAFDPTSFREKSWVVDGAGETVGAGGGASNSSSKAKEELSGGCAGMAVDCAGAGGAEKVSASSSDKGRKDSSDESGVSDNVSDEAGSCGVNGVGVGAGGGTGAAATADTLGGEAGFGAATGAEDPAAVAAPGAVGRGGALAAGGGAAAGAGRAGGAVGMADRDAGLATLALRTGAAAGAPVAGERLAAAADALGAGATAFGADADLAAGVAEPAVVLVRVVGAVVADDERAPAWANDVGAAPTFEDDAATLGMALGPFRDPDSEMVESVGVDSEAGARREPESDNVNSGVGVRATEPAAVFGADVDTGSEVLESTAGACKGVAAVAFGTRREPEWEIVESVAAVPGLAPAALFGPVLAVDSAAGALEVARAPELAAIFRLGREPDSDVARLEADAHDPVAEVDLEDGERRGAAAEVDTEEGEGADELAAAAAPEVAPAVGFEAPLAAASTGEAGIPNPAGEAVCPGEANSAGEPDCAEAVVCVDPALGGASGSASAGAADCAEAAGETFAGPDAGGPDP